jgi:hypothetical protein
LSLCNRRPAAVIVDCFCQLKTGPLDHRKQGHSGHVAKMLIVENRTI